MANGVKALDQIGRGSIDGGRPDPAASGACGLSQPDSEAVIQIDFKDASRELHPGNSLSGLQSRFGALWGSKHRVPGL